MYYLIEWLKRSLEQNKEIYCIINEIKIEQDISYELEQLTIPDDNY